MSDKELERKYELACAEIGIYKSILERLSNNIRILTKFSKGLQESEKYAAFAQLYGRNYHDALDAIDEFRILIEGE